MKIKLCIALLATVIGTSFGSTSYVNAAEPVTTNSITSIEHTHTITPKAEEIEWRYRVVDGKLQRRLWSVTWGEWRSEWEWAF